MREASEILKFILEVGVECDLETFAETLAHSDSWYDVFYLIEDLAQEREAVIKLCDHLGFLNYFPEKNGYTLNQVTTQEALDKLKGYLNDTQT